MRRRDFLRAIIWKHNEDPIEDFVSFSKLEALQFKKKHSGMALVFVETKSKSRYSLGLWSFRGYKATRPSYFGEDTEQEPIEKSALNRLHTVLKMHASIDIEIKVGSVSICAKTIPTVGSPTSPFFLVAAQDLPVEKTSESIVATATIKGMTFIFPTTVIQGSKGNLALSLPKTSARLVRRVIPRTRKSTTIQISSISTPVKVIDFSQSGARILYRDEQEYVRGQEIILNIATTERKGITTRALIMSHNREAKTLQLLIGCSHGSYKTQFYNIMNAESSDNSVTENPNLAWKSLSDNGFLALINGGLLGGLRKKCVRSWSSLLRRIGHFQPVFQRSGRPVGTIALTQTDEERWIPHALATRVDPQLIDVSAALYQAWPQYIIQNGRPAYFTTWYDNNKPWHNRFYQVFILENKLNPEVQTMVRHYYWTPSLSVKSGTSSISLRTPKDDRFIETYWRLFPGNPTELPLIPSKDGTSAFPQAFKEIVVDDTSVGIVFVMRSRHQISPFSVFNICHIFIFDALIRQNKKKIGALTEVVVRELGTQGRALAVTLDYDIARPLELEGFHYFCEARCLFGSLRELPSLMSNNALAFADIEARNLRSA